MGLKMTLVFGFLVMNLAFVTSQTVTYDTAIYRNNMNSQKLIQLISNRPQCRPNQPCSVAVCPWHADILNPDQQTCDFFGAACNCQTGTHCLWSASESLGSSTPESRYITFNFWCDTRT